MILDIAIPRDFDPRIGDLDQVMLYHVDDLRAQAEQNRLQRQKGIDPALAIIERETAACYAHAAAPARRRAPAPASWATTPTRSASASWTPLFAARPDLTEADREAIAHMAMRLQNQFLHHPRAAVRSAVDRAAPRAPPPDPRRRPPPLRPGRSVAEFAQEDLRDVYERPGMDLAGARLQAAPGHPDRLKPGLRRKTGMIR